jgi:hypothetical protein
MELLPGGIREVDVLEAFKEVVGLSREEVATFLLRRFRLEESARTRMRGLGVDTPWEAFAAVRAPIYAKMLENPEVLSKEQWPRNVALLEDAPDRVQGGAGHHVVQNPGPAGPGDPRMVRALRLRGNPG